MKHCLVITVWLLAVTWLTGGWADAQVTTRTDKETRDALLMLETGPLHLRMHLRLNGDRLQDIRDAYIDRMMKSLDANGDGKVSRQEARKSPLFSTTRTAGANKFLDSLDVAKDVDRREFVHMVERLGGEPVVYRQDLNSEKGDQKFFERLDVDGSGALEPQEMSAAAEVLAKLDLDEDQCITFDEVNPPPPPQIDPNTNRVMQASDTASERTSPVVADLLRDAREPLLSRRLIKAYDRDRDGALSEIELGWPGQRFDILDTNRNRKLDERELSRFAETTPDFEIAVELAPADNRQSIVEVVSLNGRRVDDGARRDFARISFASVVISISCRQIDPIKKALESAMDQFNQLDIDGNGYIDAAEAKERSRFQRNQIEALDLDGDGRVYGEELEHFVVVRGEPAATSCRVSLYDTGHGFFQQLDRNSDGRISQRELKLAEQSLQSLRSATETSVKRTDPVHSFHIQFAQGSFQLFAAGEQLLVNPAFQQLAPCGPIWFQRMDRNNDGDLSWAEFIGPRSVFDSIDKDHDGLVDAEEATYAESKMSSNQK